MALRDSHTRVGGFIVWTGKPSPEDIARLHGRASETPSLWFSREGPAPAVVRKSRKPRKARVVKRSAPPDPE